MFPLALFPLIMYNMLMKRNREVEKAVRAYRRHYDIGFIAGEMFYKHTERSKIHSYKKVSYTKKELTEWVLKQPDVTKLFDNWIKSGHKKDLRPSIDRVEAKTGYHLSNIQLMTWEENNQKGRAENRILQNKAVLQFTKDGEFIKEWESAIEASRAIAPKIKNHNKSNIYNVLNNHKHYNTFHGYKFEYKGVCR